MDGSIVFARWHQCDPHLTHAYLDPPESTSQTDINQLPFFAQLMAESPYTL